jgi:hypothetical protein
MPDRRPSEWHPEVLPEAWSRATNDLARRSLLAGFYLAGGTGLALQFGHRRSADLDLFREAEFDSADLRDQDGLGRVALAKGTAHLTLHGVKVSFLHWSRECRGGGGHVIARPIQVSAFEDIRRQTKARRRSSSCTAGMSLLSDWDTCNARKSLCHGVRMYRVAAPRYATPQAHAIDDGPGGFGGEPTSASYR